MAKNKSVTVLDFGSSSINLLIGERGVNNTFNIYAKAEVEYSGFLNGEFLDTSDLFTSLEHVISEGETLSRMKISEVFVGVPGEFTSVVIKNPSISFPNKRKITQIEVEELFKAEENFDNSEYVLINRSPIYYSTEDGRMLIDPTKLVANTLKGQLSYVLAQRSFINTITEMLNKFDITKVSFSSSNLATSLYILDSYERDRFAILIDIGFTTTSVMIVRGEGIIFMRSFAMGGAHIIADLYKCLEVPYQVAEELKRKISLTFAVSEQNTYDIVYQDKVLNIPAQKAHEIVEARLDVLAKFINLTLSQCDQDFPSYIDIKLTGGGISYIRGAKEYLGKVLKKNIHLSHVKVPQFDEPHLSSTYALLDLALNQKQTRTVFGKVFK